MTEIVEPATHEETSEQQQAEQTIRPARDELPAEALDVFDLKLIPPKWLYTARAEFHYVGRGEPLSYDFGDIFAAEAEDEE